MKEPSGAAVVHRYMERGSGGFANLTLRSGERVFVSLAASGLRVHRLIFWGRVPGRTLLVLDAAEVAQMVEVLGRDVAALPPLPDDAAMQSFLTVAGRALSDPGSYSAAPIDEEGHTITRLALIARAALPVVDAASLVRRLSRAAATA